MDGNTSPMAEADADSDVAMTMTMTMTATTPPAGTLDADPKSCSGLGRDRLHSRPPSGPQEGHSPHQRPKKSSSTCSTCRFRKVRCNGSRPMCSNCQRLGFPCAYDESFAESWPMSLPRRRVKQACLSCHSRKARCSGHMPACERCRAQGIECVYQPEKRVKGPSSRTSQHGHRSSHSHDGEDRERQTEDDHLARDDADSTNTPSTFHHDFPGADGAFDALIGRTLDQFFRHVHHIPVYSFLHRASLMEQCNAGKVDEALLLALVGITSCLTDMGSGMREYGDRCIDRAENLIFSDYARPSTFKVQALVFMIKHRILSNRYPSAFMLLSIASRFAAALRLNHNSPKLCFLAQESRRRLMWSLYCTDTGISAGYRDFALWRANRIFVGLPCNERNFEFDLPQPAEMLDPECRGSDAQHPEDVGSLALHVRIVHLRQKIIEFTKDVFASGTITDTCSLQEPVLDLHKQLDDFASRLPSSFQFSESSLRLRGYSPRLCVFVMIHVWWHQCHCDLYRMTMTGFREALPEPTLRSLDQGFLAHCQRQCVDHSLAMAGIFASMQKLGAKPVADLDLALCAYQCARMLKYALHEGGDKFGLTAEGVAEEAKMCLRTIEQCCMGPAAGAIRTDLQRLINQGLGSDASSSPRLTHADAVRPNHIEGSHVAPRYPLLRDFEVPEEPGVISTTTPKTTAPNRAGSHSAEPFMSDSGTTSAMQTPLSVQAAPDTSHPWNTPSSHLSALTTTTTTTTATTIPDAKADQSETETLTFTAPALNKYETVPNELNSAYEGALDIFDQDNGLAHAMGVELAPWNWSGDLQWPDFLSNAVGV